MGEGELYGRRVRIRYATLINLVTEIISYAASIAFVIIIARRLTAVEFGQWTLITRYVNYMLIASTIATYWVPRTLGRGLNTSKTALIFAIKLGLIASLSYILLAYGSSVFFNQPFPPLALASIIVLEEYVNQTMLSIAMVHAPQYIGISRMTFRFTQMSLAVISVLALKLGLMGVVLAAIGSRVVVNFLLYKVNREIITKSKYSEDITRKWLKLSWLPLFSRLSALMYAFDAVVARVVSNSDVVVAFYGVAVSILGVLMGFMRSMPALYSKLLAEAKVRYVEEILWLIFLINIPLIIGIVSYAGYLAYLYNPIYYIDSLAIRIFAVSALPLIIVRAEMAAIFGFEKRDYISRWRAKDLFHTTLFKVPLIQTIATSFYLVLVAFFIKISSENLSEAMILWGLSYLLYNVALAFAYDILAKKEFNLSIHYSKLITYTLKFFISSIPIIVLRFTYPLILTRNVWLLLRSLIPVALISGVLYVAVLYIIDRKFRVFLRSIIRRLTERY